MQEAPDTIGDGDTANVFDDELGGNCCEKAGLLSKLGDAQRNDRSALGVPKS